MSVRIINGKVYKNGAFSEEELVLKEGKIVSAQDGDAEEVYDAKGNYVVPGFIDVHTHGGAGVDVNAADQQGFEKIGHFFATQGTTSWLSSILTDTKEQTLKTIKEAVKHQEAQKNGHENCADLLVFFLERATATPAAAPRTTTPPAAMNGQTLTGVFSPPLFEGVLVLSLGFEK